MFQQEADDILHRELMQQLKKAFNAAIKKGFPQGGTSFYLFPSVCDEGKALRIKLPCIGILYEDYLCAVIGLLEVI